MTLRLPPTGDAVAGAQRQVETEPRAEGGGDRLGDHVADVPRHRGTGVVRQLVGEDGAKSAWAWW
jgi:hypothetical protein